jgi:hypothetical protein
MVTALRTVMFVTAVSRQESGSQRRQHGSWSYCLQQKRQRHHGSRDLVWVNRNICSVISNLLVVTVIGEWPLNHEFDIVRADPRPSTHSVYDSSSSFPIGSGTRVSRYLHNHHHRGKRTRQHRHPKSCCALWLLQGDFLDGYNECGLVVTAIAMIALWTLNRM